MLHRLLRALPHVQCAHQPVVWTRPMSMLICSGSQPTRELGPHRTHFASLDETTIGQQVKIAGWLQAKRVWKSVPGKPQKPAFLVLRDESGELQLTVDESATESAADSLEPGPHLASIIAAIPVESCIAVEGIVRARPTGRSNSEQHSGAIEVVLQRLEILNKAPEGVAPPLQVAAAISEDKAASGVSAGARGAFKQGGNRSSSAAAGEEARLAHRYLDLRRPLMQRNLRLRASVIHAMRRCLAEEHDFIEVETPTLFASTPEGAREFLVPTQTAGRFYALTQSPQQHKQMLMAGGITRYFQVARCYRDEGGRADRQPEFTQLDLEMAFVGEKEVQATVQAAVDSAIAAANECSVRLVRLPPALPRFQRTGGPENALPTVSYADCMVLFGSDKPRRRFTPPRPTPVNDAESLTATATATAAATTTATTLSGREFLLCGAEHTLVNGKRVLSEDMVIDTTAGSIGDVLVSLLRSQPDPRETNMGATLEDLRPSIGSVHLVRLPGLGAGLSRKRFESLARDLVHAAGGAGARCRASGMMEVVRVDAKGAWKGSALVKALSGDGQMAVSSALEANEDDVIVVAGGFGDNPYQALGAARLEGLSRGVQAGELGGVQELDMFWVTEFPLFEVEEADSQPSAAGSKTGNDNDRSCSRLTPAHHPFTAPVEADMDVMRRASVEGWGKHTTVEAVDQLACVRARSYDLVCDGSELGGGSVRLHRAADQETVFSTLQLPEARIASFEHLLKALRWGAPPHAGLAIGLDRFVALLAGAESLRDIIAFPKTAGGQDLLSGAPSTVPGEALEEYNIAVRERV